MRILLLVHAFNSLSQRVFVELEELGHEVSVEFDISDAVLREAVALFHPDLILAPFLKRAICEDIWKQVTCLIVHPGIKGDRGPSALDWAILNDEKKWGVTILQAESEMDAGPVWSSLEFKVRPGATKSSLYRNEVTQTAIKAIHQAIERFESNVFQPSRPNINAPDSRGIERPPARQSDRKVNWDVDDTKTVLRKINSADGTPGLKDEIFGRTVFLYDAHLAHGFSGKPGEVIAKSGPAICRATTDGAIWIGHLRDGDEPNTFKLPATRVLNEKIKNLREVSIDSINGYSEIRSYEKDDVGYLHFDFYNGAMSTQQCDRLLIAYREMLKRPTKVIVLMGGTDFWSNGMHLNVIKASPSAADESWRNINAIDDLAEEIIKTTSHLTVSALQGNAGAGGVFLARAADYVWLREGIILSPHYKDMGNLFGSEFWTYLLPRYTGQDNAKAISQARLPMSSKQAVEFGLGDERFGDSHKAFCAQVVERAKKLSTSQDFDQLLHDKIARRKIDENRKPLGDYRATELEKMKSNFYGFDPSYHIARYNFVHKIPKSRTPVTISRHRDLRRIEKQRRAS